MSDRKGLMRLLPFLPDRFSANGNAKAMVHAGAPSGSNWLFGTTSLLPSTQTDYAEKVGDGLGSSVLAGPLNFLMRTFPEAPPIVERRKRSGEWEEEDDHPLIQLLETPNKYYPGEILWMCTVLDFAFGEAFWYKIRNQNREVIELWWIPRALITPKWPNDGKTYISHYEYRPGSGKFDIAVDDIVHMRFGIDPRNTRRGLSPLGALMREVGVDDEAANFTGAVLKNLGIIGVIVSPKTGTVGQGNVQKVKEYLRNSFTGDKRGEPLALGAPTEVQLLQYQMQGVDVSPIRDVSEERVCAALGLPAAVVGFGTGLQQTKVGATMKEMRQLAWTGGIIPNQRIIAAEVRRSLLPEFETGKRQKARFTFDASKVRALWEDTNEKHTRVREDFKAKMIDRAAALRETGRPAKAEDEGIYFTGTPNVPVGTEPPKPDPAKPDDEEATAAAKARDVALTSMATAVGAIAAKDNEPTVIILPATEGKQHKLVAHRDDKTREVTHYTREPA
jgi:phage portal protein BeeE